MNKCPSHDELVRKIDSIDTKMDKHYTDIFNLFKDQLDKKDKLNTRIIMISIGTMVVISLGYFGLSKFIPDILKLL